MPRTDGAELAGERNAGASMETIVKAKHGHLEIQTKQRNNNRWASAFRYVPHHGPPSEWTSASSPEGFVTEGMALSAAILLGKETAEQIAAEKAGAT